MDPLGITSIITDVGYPIALSIYLIYVLNSQLGFVAKKLDDMQGILRDISVQTAYILNSNLAYKSGNLELGDAFSEQAMKIGQEYWEAAKRKGGR